MKKRIGILGGTFNPIHIGHIALAKAAKTQYNLDAIWLMPSKLPPHKSHVALLSEAHRLRMVELVADEQEGFIASDFELATDGFTYTAETLERLTAASPELEFFFILGGDSLQSFLHWREPERIVALATILYSGRANFAAADIERAREDIVRAFPTAKVLPVELSAYTVSSAGIRSAFFAGNGADVKDALPSCVFDYLIQHKLFQTVTYEELDLEMRRILSPHRYYHSIGVAHLAAALAAKCGLDANKALLAGLLHDCAKPLSDEQLVVECDKRNIPVSEVERRNGFLLHGKLAAYYAKERYYITDSEIRSAIYYHCAGHVPMEPYEQFLFIADFIEPFRTHPSQPSHKELLEIAFKDPDLATALIAKNTTDFLRKNGMEIEETSLRVVDYYFKKCEENKNG